MRLSHVLIALLVLTLPPVTASPLQAAGRVQLELVGDASGSAFAFQQWLQVLSRAGVTHKIRIRAATAADKVGIEIRGTQNSPLYVVTGVVNSSSELILPPGRFKRQDAARLVRWLDDLALHGPANRREPKSAFGLSRERFEQIQEDLARQVGFSTREMLRHEAVEKIGRRLRLPLQLDPPLAEMLKADKIAEELEALSCGTALACILRPAGLCLVPRLQAGRPTYAVVEAKPDLEVWPVGWKPERPQREVLPEMFELHNINIEGVSATVALTAIARRLKVPVLIDHNALARWGVDPDEVVVSYPQRRTMYGIALRKILAQARLKSELRLDEAGKPFLWVTTIKPM